MRRLPHRLALTAIAFIAVTQPQTATGDCQYCGCRSHCHKICRLVHEENKVETTCWGYQCEDFCVPGPSKRICQHCDTVCEFCREDKGPDSPVTAAKRFLWTEWAPGGAKVYTRRKLLKRPVTKTIPGYKWVVEEVCPKCEVEHGASADITPGVPVPPLPAREFPTTRKSVAVRKSVSRK